ncbi:FecR family protein [Sanguibacteroides sp. AM78-02pH3A]|uniref:FecR family protein n=1 Tax=Sanguibacteroides sp. AM78-02pH3A TaxID=3002646 RepID=UPI0022E8AE5B|nr:FecR domain-containing protein [Sanguibacteroides sp. AM78-02pH3A]
MSYHEEDIKFAIKILSCRKALENREVEQWMSIPEHVELLKELVAIRQKSSTVDFEQDRSAVYFHLRQTIGRRKRRRLIWYRSIAASVVLLGFSAIWAVKELQITGRENSTIRTEAFRPEGAAIELILSDGQTIQLSKTGSGCKDLSATGIRNDSLHGLSYAEVKVDSSGEEIYNTLNVPKGGFYPIELSDGTKVWLNSETSLRYPVRFTERERRVYLRGEAYFEVAYDNRYPFVVNVGGMEVKVLGTRFNVNCYDRDTIRTTLVDGSVCIKDVFSDRETLLCPDEMATYCRSTRLVTKEKVDPFVYTAWKEGKFVFENETVEEIMKRLSRWYDIEVVYENQEIRYQTFTGIMERFSDVRDILHLIEETATVKFDIENHVIVVK